MTKKSKDLNNGSQFNQLNEWSDEQKKGLQDELLYWYDNRKRDLPWRLNQDPYRIWVSEIMLQQTQVVTVIPYFERFMTWFPNIKALAEAPEDRLLKAWEGLGYYSRVRNMQKAAQQITTDFAGEMPNDIEAISTLKGIGPYTAGAISSIAFDLPEPAIDGNVMRVYSRLFEVTADMAKASSRKEFDYLVRGTISQDDPSSFNQALMDLGASICAPTNPDCPTCPLKEFCLSYANNTTTTFPVKSKKQKAKPVYYDGYVIRNQSGDYLIEQRAESGLLANLWQFPLVEQAPKAVTLSENKVAEEAPVYLIEQHKKINWQPTPIGEITHIFSHLKWCVTIYSGVVKNQGNFKIKDNQRWVSMSEMAEYPMPKPQLKMLEVLKKQ